MSVQESDRKLKIMGLEAEKMRNKLQVLVERERISKSRYSQLLSGSDVSVVVKGLWCFSFHILNYHPCNSFQTNDVLY